MLKIVFLKNSAKMHSGKAIFGTFFKGKITSDKYLSIFAISNFFTMKKMNIFYKKKSKKKFGKNALGKGNFRHFF
jgi:hypothetical protein